MNTVDVESTIQREQIYPTFEGFDDEPRVANGWDHEPRSNSTLFSIKLRRSEYLVPAQYILGNMCKYFDTPNV